MEPVAALSRQQLNEHDDETKRPRLVRLVVGELLPSWVAQRIHCVSFVQLLVAVAVEKVEETRRDVSAKTVEADHYGYCSCPWECFENSVACESHHFPACAVDCAVPPMLLLLVTVVGQKLVAGYHAPTVAVVPLDDDEYAFDRVSH